MRRRTLTIPARGFGPVRSGGPLMHPGGRSAPTGPKAEARRRPLLRRCASDWRPCGAKTDMGRWGQLMQGGCIVRRGLSPPVPGCRSFAAWRMAGTCSAGVAGTSCCSTRRMLLTTIGGRRRAGAASRTRHSEGGSGARFADQMSLSPISAKSTPHRDRGSPAWAQLQPSF
jgi:hypothetical protein